MFERSELHMHVPFSNLALSICTSRRSIYRVMGTPRTFVSVRLLLPRLHFTTLPSTTTLMRSSRFSGGGYVRLADDTQPASSEPERHERHERQEEQEQRIPPELPPLMPPIEKEGHVEKRERRGPQTTGAFQKLPMYVVFGARFASYTRSHRPTTTRESSLVARRSSGCRRRTRLSRRRSSGQIGSGTIRS